MYRILIAPLAQRLLRTLPEPMLSRVGHVMAKAADEVGFDSARSTAARSSAAGRLAKLEVEGLALTYAIDPVKHTLTVRRIAPA